MENKRFNCLMHEEINEIYCKTCKSFICPKCITNHTNDGHIPEYQHILDYSPKEILPKIDSLLTETKKKEGQIVHDINDVLNSMQMLLPELTQQVDKQEKKCEELRRNIHKLKMYSSHAINFAQAGTIKQCIVSDQTRMKEALNSHSVSDVIRLVVKLKAEKEQSNCKTIDLLREMEDSVEELKKIGVYDNALAISEIIMATRC